METVFLMLCSCGYRGGLDDLADPFLLHGSVHLMFTPQFLKQEVVAKKTQNGRKSETCPGETTAVARTVKFVCKSPL